MTADISARRLAGPTSRSFIAFARRPAAEVRLYCIPFAGGSAAAYRPWAHLLPESIELRAGQLPGRQDRLDETPHRHWSAAVRALADELSPELASGPPYGIFGHSMGGLLAWELTRELRRRDVPLPALLAISGRAAPHTGDPVPVIYRHSDAQFVEAVDRLGGIPKEVTALPDLLAVVLPALRADLEICNTYSYAAEPRLACPISVFGGSDDRLAPAPQLRAWAAQTTRFRNARIYPGGHFYLAEHQRDVVAALAGDLLQEAGNR